MPLTQAELNAMRRVTPSKLGGHGSSISAKVAHVRAARDAGRHGGHHCHWPDCDKQVPPAMWGCKRHWFMLPQDLRTRVWRAFKPGQEDTKAPSREYVAVAREVQDWIAANHPPAAKQEPLL